MNMGVCPNYVTYKSVILNGKEINEAEKNEIDVFVITNVLYN